MILLLALFLFGSGLPNKKITPGAIKTADAKVICAKTFRTRDERNTTDKMKKHICQLYEVKDCPKYGAMEIDHLVSLEIGGADTEENLWVQYAPDYHRKDRLEGQLHREVCSGKITLKEAQRCIVDNWKKCADQHGVK